MEQNNYSHQKERKQLLKISKTELSQELRKEFTTISNFSFLQKPIAPYLLLLLFSYTSARDNLGAFETKITKRNRIEKE